MRDMPEWLNERQDATGSDDPLASLRELGRWLDDGENRSAMHAFRDHRRAELEKAETQSRERLGGFTIGEVGELERKVADAKARLKLAELVLELAEATRLRVALVLRSPVDDTVPASWLRETTHAIGSDITAVKALLTNATFTYPQEAAATADSLLLSLVGGVRSAGVNATEWYLSGWAKAASDAHEILRAAPADEV